MPRAPVAPAAALAAGLGIAERYRVTAIAERRFTHAQLWSAMAQVFIFYSAIAPFIYPLF